MNPQYRPLLPRPEGEDPVPPADTPTTPLSRPCDNRRPSCQNCQKRGLTCSYRHAERFARLAQSDPDDLAQLLRTLPEEQALDLFRTLRSQSVRSEMQPVSHLTPQLSERQVLQVLLPPTQNSLEFELTIRHPIAYPTLYSLPIASLPTEKLLRPTRIGRLKGSLPSSHPTPSQASPGEGSSSNSQQLGSRATTPPGLVARPHAATDVIDERLRQVDISRWTDVPITDELAAQVISLYFQIDYPVLPIFHGGLFLDDLVNGREHFCSRFLVSALLGWACQAYTALKPEAETDSLSLQFFHESETYLAEADSLNTMTAVAAIQLLCMTSATYGKDDLSVDFLRNGLQVGKRMGLFGVTSEQQSAQTWLDDHHPWRLAASYTAWGVFNWAVLYGLHYHRAVVEVPPLLPKPGALAASPTLHNESVPAPQSHVQVFDACCDLWSICNEIIWKFYAQNDGGPSPRTPPEIEFAEETYHRLLSWADHLPVNLARGDHNTHAIMMMHVYFHAIITDLFRPLVHDGAVMRSFDSAQQTPKAVYAASINQLKRLLLIYRLTFSTATLSVLWQTALVYVANAMVQEADNSSGNREWRFYLGLCLAGVEDLYVSFRVFGSIARGLLAMAIQRGAMAGRTAHRVQSELQELGRHHDASISSEPMRARLIVDLDLALRDKYAAQGTNVADRFRDMMLGDYLRADQVTPGSPEEGLHGQPSVGTTPRIQQRDSDDEV